MNYRSHFNDDYSDYIHAANTITRNSPICSFGAVICQIDYIGHSCGTQVVNYFDTLTIDGVSFTEVSKMRVYLDQKYYAYPHFKNDVFIYYSRKLRVVRIANIVSEIEIDSICLKRWHVI